jgi:hypothetical protein
MRLLAFDHAPKHRYDAFQKLLAFLGLDGIFSDPSSRSPTQLLNRTARRYTSSFS